MKKRIDIISGTLLAVVAAALFIYGASKAPIPRAVVYWDDPFTNPSHTIDTNDLRHITFEWNAPPLYIPLDARANITAVYLHDTDTPTPFAVTNVSMFAFGADVWMQYDATNYAFYAECSWVPEPSVITNGVYHIPAVGTGERAVPIGARVEITCTAREYVQDGLVAMWDGIEHGGDPFVWSDISGNGYDATQRVNNAGWAWSDDAYVGTAQNGHGFTVPTALNATIRKNFTNLTFEVVFKPDYVSRQTIFGQYMDANTPSNRGGFNIEYSSHLAGKFRAYFNGAPDLNTTAVWNTRKTFCAVVTQGGVYVYENGTLSKSSSSTSSTPVAACFGTSAPYIIGGENQRSNMSIRGELCAVRIYSRALSADEIAHNYKIDKVRFNLP